MKKLIVVALLIAAAIQPALAWRKGGPVHSSSIGMNVDGGQFNAIGGIQTSQAFLNILKSNIGWGIVNGNSCTGVTNWVTNLQVDANGYPTTMVMVGTGGCAATEFQIVTNFLSGSNYDGSPAYSSGTYVLKYNGVGTATVDTNCVFVESGGTGRDIYNCGSLTGFIRLRVTAINAGNPIRDFALVYSPDSTGVSGGNHVGVNEALLNTGEVWNPAFVARTKPFAALRFMDAFSILVNPTANWADRTPLGYFSYTLNPAVFPNPNIATNIGLPPEAAIALCNEVQADCWLNIPIEYTTAAITSFATLAHTTLDPRVRAIVEYGNEFFNNNFPCCGVGNYLDAQAIITGSGSRINQGIVGSVLANDIWLSVYGADAPTRLVRTLGGQSGFQARNQFIMAYTLPGIFSGTAATHATYFTTAPYWDFVGQFYPIAWSGDPDPYDKFFKQAAGNPLIIPPTTAANCATVGTSTALTASSNTANCGVNGSIPATPANGQFIVVNLNQSTGVNPTLAIDGGTPFALTDGDGNAFNNVLIQQNNITSGTYNSGTGAVSLALDGLPQLGTHPGNSVIISGATGTGSFAAINGTAVKATAGTNGNNVLNFTVATGLTMTITGGTVTFDQQIFCFTNATIAGAVTPTWRQALGDFQDLGTMPLGVFFYTQNYADATNAGLGLIGYEAGQNFAPGNDATRKTWFNGSMRDARMGPLYINYFTQLNTVSHGALTMHYNQIGTFGTFGLWGSMEGVLMPGSPRYNAMQNFQGGSGATCGVGALDLSTGCAQLMAFGGLF